MEDFNEKISQKWEEAKNFVKDPATKEKVQMMYDKVKTKVQEVKEDEKVQDILKSAVSTVDATITSISESETLHKVKNNVSNTIETIKNDDTIKENVKKAKKATLSFTKKALSSIEKMLEKDNDEPIVHTIVDVESNNNE